MEKQHYKMIESYASLHIIKKDPNYQMDGIYSHFQSTNLIIYLDPTSPFDEDILCRMAAHAMLYIEDHDVDPTDITLTVMRHDIDRRLLQGLLETGGFEKDNHPGKYILHGYLDFPYWVVIMSELQGENNVLYRAYSDNAKPADIMKAIEIYKQETDPKLKGYMRTVLSKIIRENQEAVKELLHQI